MPSPNPKTAAADREELLCAAHDLAAALADVTTSLVLHEDPEWPDVADQIERAQLAIRARADRDS